MLRVFQVNGLKEKTFRLNTRTLIVTVHTNPFRFINVFKIGKCYFI